MVFKQDNEEDIVSENVSYVLGMYDMYRNDKEIIDMLKMKGLSDTMVQRILLRIKKPAYEKRIRQAKRIILFAGLLILVLVVIPYLSIVLSGNSPADFLNPDESEDFDPKRDGMILYYFKYLLHLAFYIIVLVSIQFIYGFYSLLKYKRLLKSDQ